MVPSHLFPETLWFHEGSRQNFCSPPPSFLCPSDLAVLFYYVIKMQVSACLQFLSPAVQAGSVWMLWWIQEPKCMTWKVCIWWYYGLVSQLMAWLGGEGSDGNGLSLKSALGHGQSTAKRLSCFDLGVLWSALLILTITLKQCWLGGISNHILMRSILQLLMNSTWKVLHNFCQTSFGCLE